MIFVLIIYLLTLLFLLKIMRKLYILSPSVIFFSVFIFSLGVAATTGFDIGMSTFIAISLAGTVVFFSDIISSTITFQIKHGSLKYKGISSRKTLLVIIFMAIVTWLDFVDIRNYAQSDSANFLLMIADARENSYMEEETISHSHAVLQGLYLSKVLTYIYIYIIFYRKILLKESVNFLYYVPIALFVIQAFLTTGRTEFIYMIYTILIIFYLLKQSEAKWSSKTSKGMIKIIGFCFIVFLCLFLLISTIRAGGELDYKSNLTSYIGGSIWAFDKYTEVKGLSSQAAFWGEQTQPLIYSVLAFMGDSHKQVVMTLPMMDSKIGCLNIYTALGRYIHDYGVFGMALIVFVVLFLYNFLFKIIKNQNSNGLKVIIYALVTYPVVEMSIEERFFCHLVSARTVFLIVYLIIFYKVLITNSKQVRVE